MTDPAFSIQFVRASRKGMFFSPLAALLLILLAGGAQAQWSNVQIPNFDKWAASPHARFWEEPFRHWDEDGMVPKVCSRCHTSTGFRDFIGADGTDEGSDKDHLPGYGITCIACHNDVTREMTSVTFPSGATIENLGPESRCMACHQGRESTNSVNKALTGKAEDTVDKKIQFINVHYRGAGATRYGTQAKGGYEYAGKTYAGYYLHDKDFQSCLHCHETHTVAVKVEQCQACHKETTVKSKRDMQKIRRAKADFDGDGNANEGIVGEIKTLHGALLAAIMEYAKTKAGTPVVFDEHAYPYFFADKNGNAKVDRGEAIYPNRYQAWTPRLLRAAYNYQFVNVDPGAYTHNPAYVIQLLHDSLADLGTQVSVNMKGMSRP